MPINGKTGIFNAKKLHGDKSLGEILAEQNKTPEARLKAVDSVYAQKIFKVTDANNDANNDDGDKTPTISETKNGSSLIDTRLQLFDGDALKILLEEYILFQNLKNDTVRNDRKNFYLSIFYSSKNNENLQNLGIYKINLFTKQQLGLLCWVLYGEPSNAFAQYQSALQQ